MSSVVYATPVFSKTVRYRDVEEDGADWEERNVAIYGNQDGIREEGPHSQGQRPVQRKTFRAAALCLGALCLLMIAGIIIVLSIKQVSGTLENEQLETELNNLSNGYNQSQDQEIPTQGVTVNNSQLKDGAEHKKNKTEGKLCSGGWRQLGCSCYFKSTEKKTWRQSRKDCQSRGSDLVIINDKEEQKFVSGLDMNGESWIGLRKTQNLQISKGYVWEWQWVDKSPLLETFSATGDLEDPTDWSYAACCDHKGKLTKSKNFNDERNWICEKKISLTETCS